jgi:anti-sigma-K factor RskA
MPYKEGLPPQAHYGGLAMQELEQRQYAFQQQLEQDKRKWERQLELDRRAFEKALSDQAQEAEDKRHNLIFWIAIAAIALAVAQVLAAILSAGPDSFIGKLLGL